MEHNARIHEMCIQSKSTYHIKKYSYTIKLCSINTYHI